DFHRSAAVAASALKHAAWTQPSGELLVFVREPPDALLWIYLDATSRQLKEAGRYPANQVLTTLCLMHIANPGIPGGDIVAIEVPPRFGLRCAVREVIIGNVAEQASACQIRSWTPWWTLQSNMPGVRHRFHDLLAIPRQRLRSQPRRPQRGFRVSERRARGTPVDGFPQPLEELLQTNSMR